MYRHRSCQLKSECLFFRRYQVCLHALVDLRFSCISQHNSGQYRLVARLADTSIGVRVFSSSALNAATTFTIPTFLLSWNNSTVSSSLPCESTSRVLMAGVWAPNMTSLVTFHLKSSWPVKMSIDLLDLIESNGENNYRTATFSTKTNIFHEIRIEFACNSPSPATSVSLQ